MATPPSHLNRALVFTVMSFVLSRSFCRVAGEVKRMTVGPVLRTFTGSSPNFEEASDKVVRYAQLKTMLSNHDIQLFDVRNPDEYQAGHIPEAVSIPLGNLEESLKLSPEDFQQKFGVTAPGKDDANIVLYCKSGKRGAKALDVARQLGFSRVRHYEGGYSEWAAQEGN